MNRIFVLLACAGTLSAQAQLTITDSLSVPAISTLLEGIGVTVSNVTVNCPERALGHFVGSSELAITEGLLLTTGSADQVAGPVSYFANDELQTAGDIDLEQALGGGYTFDACALEFDCVPQGDTLLFNFSFGSEEYPEYVGSAYNDVFAIFLSGPGFNPPVNVATIPGGTIVAIDNVNDNSNSVYYHNNEAPIPGQLVRYDGFTTNLTVFAVVVPGQAYHFKVAIADVADMAYDSGVFLEAFSFRSPVISTAVNEVAASLRVVTSPNAVQLSGPLSKGQPVLVLSQNGALVQQATIAGPVTALPTEGLHPGLYVVHLPGSGLASVRFVKD
ncbi:MAG TPA: choice-of-anchor L domain-containing protein [Flavobacteriales bacterium]|nr:choice-of-anchor L domain-containing protein [Flavobacteriales bacterium]HQW87725.1 choice-of-anchor L domain-containing protein [Flavobacteriales bacterium]